MDNVIEFGKRHSKPDELTFVVDTTVYMNQDGEFEVSMEIGDVDDGEVFDALIAVAMKYATDHDLHEIEVDTESPANDN